MKRQHTNSFVKTRFIAHISFMLTLIIIISMFCFPLKSLAVIYSDNARTLRIGTYNIHHGASEDEIWTLDRIADQIKANNLDVVGVQEVDQYTDRCNMDTLSYLSQRSGLYYTYFSNAMWFQGGQYGVAVLSRYPIIYRNTCGLHYWGGYCEPRVLQHCQIQLDDGYVFNFFNTHLCFEEDCQKIQFREIASLCGGCSPYILTGDFNANYNEMKSTITGQKFAFSGGIDNIIATSSTYSISAAKKISSWYSDHNMAICEVKVKTGIGSAKETSVPTVNYASNVGGAWQGTVKNAAVSGNSTGSNVINQIKISLSNCTGTISYASYTSVGGWTAYAANGAASGTKGIEAIKVKASGSVGGLYNVYYRVYTQGMGWLDWAKNDAVAGTLRGAKPILAYQVMLVPKVSYGAHVQDIGWQNQVKDGAAAGTTGRGLRVEALQISLDNTNAGGISYSVHSANIGWLTACSNGSKAGTTAYGYSIEAFKLNLTGTAAKIYDVYYRAHVQSIGWQTWVKNGAVAGTTGKNLRLEAFQIQVVPKGASLGTTSSKTYTTNVKVTYNVNGGQCSTVTQNVVFAETYSAIPNATRTGYAFLGWYTALNGGSKVVSTTRVTATAAHTLYAHWQQATPATAPYVSYSSYFGGGWQTDVINGTTSGAAGYNSELQGLKISLKNCSGTISYSTYSKASGWSAYVNGGNASAKSGTAYSTTAVKIKLSGDISNKYNIFYRTYTEGSGWLGWASNNAAAGSVSGTKRMMAFEAILVPKVICTAHVQSFGWMSAVKDNAVCGSEGKAKRLEALKISLANTAYGGITYSAHVSSIGWQSFVSNGAVAGTTGKALRIEALKIKLTGNAANLFDVYYTTHVQDTGWLKYSANGAVSGTTGKGLRAEAMKAYLVPKGAVIGKSPTV